MQKTLATLAGVMSAVKAYSINGHMAVANIAQNLLITNDQASLDAALTELSALQAYDPDYVYREADTPISSAPLSRMILSTMEVAGKQTSTSSIFHSLINLERLQLTTLAQIPLLQTTSLQLLLTLLTGYPKRTVMATKPPTFTNISRTHFTPETPP
jgi:hypothetical protein